jgi:hypothetical protein
LFVSYGPYRLGDIMGMACSMNAEKQNAYRMWVGNPERKRPLRRPRRKWKNKTKMGRTETGWNDVDWIDLA